MILGVYKEEGQAMEACGCGHRRHYLWWERPVTIDYGGGRQLEFEKTED